MTITQKIRKIGIQKYTFLKSAQNSASIGGSYINIWATLNFCNIRAYGNFVESMQTLALLRNQWYCDFLIKYDPLQLFKPVEQKLWYLPCPNGSVKEKEYVILQDLATVSLVQIHALLVTTFSQPDHRIFGKSAQLASKFWASKWKQINGKDEISCPLTDWLRRELVTEVPLGSTPLGSVTSCLI